MTLHDADRIFRHWAKVPPLRVIALGVAKSLGVEFTPAEKPRYTTAEELERLAQMTTGLNLANR